MSDLTVEVAKKLKERENPTPIGACLGKILEPLPNIRIELLGGHGKLDADKIYLANNITNRLAIECTIKDFESQGNSFENGKSTYSEMSSSGITPTSISKHSGSMKISNHSNQKENKDKGKFILQTVFNLEKGMFVLVIPNFEEDKFFVVDVFNPALEVDLEWEYYQR